MNSELKDTDYLIFPKLPISDVVDASIKQYLTKQEKNYFEKSHFDFVIADKNHYPAFVIEFDGPYHLEKKEVKLRDIRKNRICQIAGLPLLRITDYELEKKDSFSIVRFIIYRFIKWSHNYEKIKKKLENELTNMSKEEYELVVSDRYIDVGYNPDYIFHIEHPFPLKKNVIDELYNKHKVANEPTENNYWYSINKYGCSSIDGFHSASFTYGIYKGKRNNSTFTFNEGKLKTKGIEILSEEKIDYVMRYDLVTVENLNHKVISIEDKLILPIYYSDIPGANIPNICEAVAEYVCYKKVLMWMEQNT